MYFIFVRSPCDNLLATASIDNSVIIWKIEKMRTKWVTSIYKQLKDHSGWVSDVKWDPLQQALLSISYDNTIKIYNRENNLKFDKPLSERLSEPFKENKLVTYKMSW